MIPFNHHHLYYFWVVAREGSIAKACHKLFLAQPTVSAQIIQLEKSLKKKLFAREKRSLVLTEDGRLVFDYASLIFNYSQEMMDALKDRPGEQVLRVQMGITDQVPKSCGLRLLRKAMTFPGLVQPFVATGRSTQLMQELKTHSLDLILTHRDVPLEDAQEYVKVDVGTLSIDFVASRPLARRIKRFPQDLAHGPLLLPGRQTPVGAAAEDYLNHAQVVPSRVGEVRDVELLRLLALDGAAVVAVDAMSVKDDVRKGRLIRLNKTRTGITQSLWLVAKKRHRLNPVADFLLKTFRLGMA